jgi:hypothetical protein
MAKVSILDLTVAQVAAIEKHFGVPVNRWQTDIVSQAELYLQVMAARGVDASEMSMREILAAVSFDDAKDATENP